MPPHLPHAQDSVLPLAHQAKNAGPSAQPHRGRGCTRERRLRNQWPLPTGCLGEWPGLLPRGEKEVTV